MMNSVDLAFSSALEQAKLIRSRQVSPLELVELYLERIEQFNDTLGCYFSVAAEEAIAQGKAQTEQLAKTTNVEQLPPFFGVPIPIKDLNGVKGLPQSLGLACFKDRKADYDDGVVMKIKEAGFIILGKTATSELGSLPYTEPPGFPPARNPWNLEYTPGGSSGGAAAAVAAGLCSVAQGSDGGGSVRGPAFCCGLVGIKPSRGRISYAPVGDHQNGIAANGVLARSVADAAALLDVMSGYIPGDPYWLPNPEPSFLDATRQSLPQLKIAFATSVSPVGQAAEICQQGVMKTVKQLEAMGHILEEINLDFGALIEPFKTVWQGGIASSGIPPEIMSSMNQWIFSQSGSAGEYLQAVMQMQIFSRQLVSLLAQFDGLVLPTYLHSTIKIGQWASLSPQETLEKVISWIFPCPPFNATGLPAIALPTGFDANGVPVGVQIVGKPAGEATLITLAAQLEEAQLWTRKRPALFNT